MQRNYSLTDNLANSFIIKTLATELSRAIHVRLYVRVDSV